MDDVLLADDVLCARLEESGITGEAIRALLELLSTIVENVEAEALLGME